MRVLQCPVCREPMIVAEYEGFEIDTCGGCGGVWLDSGELEALVGTAVPPTATPDSDLGPPDRDCPICVDKLIKDRYGRTQVVVDRCPHGDGIWLDAGELQQIFAAYPQAPAEPGHHEDHATGALRCFFSAPPPLPPKDPE